MVNGWTESFHSHLHFSPYTFLQMTTTFQRNALDISYNGWENYETWNVALWIQNDEGLYNIASEAGSYAEVLECAAEIVRITDQTVSIFCEGTASVWGTVTPESVANQLPD